MLHWPQAFHPTNIQANAIQSEVARFQFHSPIFFSFFFLLCDRVVLFIWTTRLVFSSLPWNVIAVFWSFEKGVQHNELKPIVCGREGTEYILKLSLLFSSYNSYNRKSWMVRSILWSRTDKIANFIPNERAFSNLRHIFKSISTT